MLENEIDLQFVNEVHRTHSTAQKATPWPWLRKVVMEVGKIVVRRDDGEPPIAFVTERDVQSR